MDITLVAILIGALGLGAAHAFEVDHLAAVSAFVAQRPSPRVAWSFGVRWAAGHGFSLLILGSILYLFKLTFSISLAGTMERLVGVSLVLVGLWTLFQLRPAALHHTHGHSHSPDEKPPAAPVEGPAHTHADGTTHSHAQAKGALWMGVLHGVAGTAAFAGEALVAVSQTYLLVLAFTFAFSVGVLIAMGAYAALLGSAMTWSGRRFSVAVNAVRVLSGVGACLVGLYWIIR